MRTQPLSPPSFLVDPFSFLPLFPSHPTYNTYCTSCCACCTFNCTVDTPHYCSPSISGSFTPNTLPSFPTSLLSSFPPPNSFLFSLSISLFLLPPLLYTNCNPLVDSRRLFLDFDTSILFPPSPPTKAAGQFRIPWPPSLFLNLPSESDIDELQKKNCPFTKSTRVLLTPQKPIPKPDSP
jgi:hypothetical protein